MTRRSPASVWQTGAPTDFPKLHEAEGLASGTIYVTDDTLAPLLNKDVKAVLETEQGGQVEVRTCNSIGGTITAPGTYLHASDYGPLVGQTPKNLRPYTRKDTRHKIRSAPGALTALTALLSVLTAAIGTAFVLLTLSSPTSTTVSDRAETLMEWVASPATGSNQSASAALAGACLKEIRGQTTTKVTVPGIECTSIDTPWYHDSNYGALITGALGVLTALVGVVTLRSKFGFQKAPAL